MEKKSGLLGRLEVKAFTLIELLVVVLIIGILAAVALPQYEKAVEKARMSEAVTLVRAIANANQVFYMANGRYANVNEMELLDVDIPGSATTTLGGKRTQTKFFIYSPNGLTDEGTDSNCVAVGQRVARSGGWHWVYNIYIVQSDPGRIKCRFYAGASDIQRKLCDQLNTNGTL